MAFILHLSDLHLSELIERQVTGDYKVQGLIPLAERQNRLELLRNSLSALDTWLTRQSIDLDAIAVTGDVSLAYDDAGFAALPETLNYLGAHALPPERTLVVPGNHDVKWETPPSSAPRYEKFLQHVRAHGYVTPLLEGIDIDPDSGAALGSHSPLLTAVDGAWVLAAVNSANYCGSARSLTTNGQSAFEAAVAAASDEETRKEIEGLLLHDIARVSPAQLTALRSAFSGFDSPSEGGPLRFAALHHQLLPVAADEEFKTFENLTNLGQFRQFLVAQEVSTVVHGHKHQGLCYTDQVTFAGEQGPRPNGYLVVSSATVWRQVAAGHEFARLIEVNTTFPKARRLEVLSLAATPAGGEMSEPIRERAWTISLKTDHEEHRPFRAATSNDAYEKMMSFFDTLPDDHEVHGLMCVVEDGPSARTVPDSYPRLDGAGDPQQWLDDIVEWWQRPDPDLSGRGRRFNHGERIRNLNRHEQIDDVVKALKDAPGTTRALVQIVDPARDQISDVDQRIPSFFACHFYWDVRQRKLNCTGYFRKQQMRMWWPVNVAEIATLQEEVVGKLAQVGGENVEAGSITTFAMVALEGTDRPRVVVPRVDRLAQDAPEELWRVAYDLFVGDHDAAGEELLTFFDDWRPTGKVERDGSAVSLGGMRTLQAAIALFAEKADSDPGRRLARQLENIYAANAQYVANEETTVEASRRALHYETWAGQIDRAATEVRELIDELRR